mmetsp:Transcript_24133/g.52071  ORF Transcript_24133/g.52071 Transcript_24133/m.52071 type:complete len:363 (+) Transcript_24133:148-1236(+)
MTVTFNDEPEIVLGGDDPAPSAPPAFASMTGDGRPPTATAGLPTAIGTPISLPTATMPPPSAAATTTTTSSGGNIERTTNSDGSLSVKITTTTPQPNGYREVKMEYFHIPADVATAVNISLDNGDPPSSLYMTKMEQQILPPGTGTVMSRPPAPANPTQGYTSTTQPSSGTPDYTDHGLKHCWGICCGVFCLVIVILFIIGAVGGSVSNSSNTSPSRSRTPPPWHAPTPRGPYSYPATLPPMFRRPYTPSWTPPSQPQYSPTRSRAPVPWHQKPIQSWPPHILNPSPPPPTTSRLSQQHLPGFRLHIYFLLRILLVRRRRSVVQRDRDYRRLTRHLQDRVLWVGKFMSMSTTAALQKMMMAT